MNNKELAAKYRAALDHIPDLKCECGELGVEVERLQEANAQLVKTPDIREAALRDLLDAMRSTDPIQAANCRVLEYHQLKEEVERLTAERDALEQRYSLCKCSVLDLEQQRDAAVARAGRAPATPSTPVVDPEEHDRMLRGLYDDSAPDKPHYAALEPEPWGGPDGEEGQP